MPGEAPNTAEVVAEFAKNTQEQVRLSISRYRGRDYADIRVWVENDAGERIPTKKGLTLDPEVWPQLMAGLRKLEGELVSRGLIDKEDLEVGK